MGFDLTGVMPRNEKPECLQRIDSEGTYSKLSDEEKEVYHLAYQKWNSDDGVYFRNNCWWWRPLWDYVYKHCNCLTEEEYQSGQYNDGLHIDCDKALDIYNALKQLKESGHTEKYEEQHKKYRNSLPKVKCTTCNGTGQRDDQYVQGECNVCKGEGKKESFETSYPFSAENAYEFMEFCKHSGGFEIW